MEQEEKKELKELKKQKEQEEKDLKHVLKKTKKKIKLREKEEKEANLTPHEREIKLKNEPPHLSILEEIGNAVTHGVGAILAIVALILMITHSKSNNELMVSSFIYGFSLLIMMLNSTLYHSWKSGSKVKRLWRRFDYSSIYFVIGGTFTPLLLYELHYNNNVPYPVGLTWFIIMWLLIILGITMTSIFGPGRVKFINFPLYFILGWAGVAFVPIWVYHERIALMLWIFFGGLVYTLGMIPFGLLKGKKSAHFIWHFFVLAGVAIQFIGVYMYVYL